MLKLNKLIVFFCLIVWSNCLLAQKPDTAKSGIDLIEEIQRDIERQNRQRNVEPVPDPQRVPPTTPTDRPIQQLPPPQQVIQYITKPLKPKKEPYKLYKHELQLEVGSFFNQVFTIFGLTDTGAAYSPSNYFIAYKFKPKRKDEVGAFRLGLGGVYRKRKDTKGGFADNVQVINQDLNMRLGYEFQKRLATEWVWTFGADVLANRQIKKTISDSGFDQVTIKTVGWERGFAFNSGVRWDFAERLSIGTEINLKFAGFRGETEQIFTANPQFNKKVSVNEEDVAAQFIGPANVYLSIRF